MRVVGVAALLLSLLAAAAHADGTTRNFLFTQTAPRGTTVLVSDAAGVSETDLTLGAGLGYDPAWSPDGTQVAFVSNRETEGVGPTQVYIADTGGTSLRRLTNDPSGYDHVPAWSPDGRTIAYAGGAAQSADVYAIPAAGGTPALLAPIGATIDGVAWSPDGSKILADVQGKDNVVEVFEVATHSLRLAVPGVGAAWSPDSTRIACRDHDGHLVVRRIDNGDTTQLTTLSAGDPTWAPDGSRVVFSASTYDASVPVSKFGYPMRTDLYVSPADGSAPPRRITGPFAEHDTSAPPATRASFAPDGNALLFREPGKVLIANDDGTCARPLPFASVEQGPYWRPGATSSHVTCVDLYARAAVDSAYVGLGEPAAVTITVENHGNEVARHVALGLQPRSSDVTVVGCSNCPLPDILPGETVQARIGFASPTAGFRGIGFAVTSSPGDLTPPDATGLVSVQVLPCTTVGTEGADHIAGTARNDRICARPGADWISGGAGDDYIDAGNGNDTVYGGTGHDTILARGGRDTIFARDGQRDWIDCGTEYDVAVVDKLDHVHHCERVLRG